jgi:isocitrate dehydrogenase (NAD+)
MLNHIGEGQASKKLQAAIERVYAEGKPLTPDVGGSSSTAEFTNAVVKHIG